MNWRELELEVLTLGGTAEDKRMTGERVWRHPKVAKPFTFNRRRKDASIATRSFVKRIKGAER